MLNDLKGKKVIDDYKKIIEDKNEDINAVISQDIVYGNSNGDYYGIPFLVKDNINILNTSMTCSSKILKDYRSVYTATVVERLINRGFSVIGKTNMDEFAMGGTNEYSVYGPVKNPLDLNRVSGGSSGGSAAAVSCGMVPFALGSDTGGSVRQPASFCGVVGFKPSYGVLSRYGLTAFGSSLDQIGVLAKDVFDVALITDIMKGKDEKDSTTISFEENLMEYLNKDFSDIKIAIPSIVYDKIQDENVKKAFDNAVNKIKANKVTIDIVDIPEMEYSVAAYYIIAPSEASSNLSRFDGARYGNRIDGEGLTDMYKNTRNNGFGIEVKRRILMGTFTLSSAYYDAYFSKAMKVRNLIKTKIEEIFKEYDFILTPTAPVLPPKFDEKLSPLDRYLMDIFTIPANFAGTPAISVPFGNIDHLSFGIQFMGRRLEDAKLLGFANQIFKLGADE
ncbi:MAG: aspartyl-tRNA(Asn)/glutamyl-tRNA(Gln) amidotransferase subunit [Oceanotoga sp.]|uniref:Asp-tRNA(Asn)/Glu-tRNA(Gln) amidotransferase subunit GatA n=1 Tax=Oceanotoga sp. TaxID=2108366 RepID=UPI002650BBFC|nr:Asp-tRNA(Asn)/Glu-tRNA(Gln) amidotransferase subunit GatA [Oceanotoga sp.]MDN5343606.1 aspartyl-tRNA(Asn)/glutamyl-tRNA(Gln) amidotransferase subunit [Oceanotoga sp.]